MDCQFYGYTPRRAAQAPRRRRRRSRRRRGVPPVFRAGALCLLPVAALLILALRSPGKSTAAASAPQTSAAEDAAAPSAPAVQAPPVRGEAPSYAVPDAAPADTYDFSAPVPESPPVDGSYFDDAVFIGDSRTEGLLLNTGLYNAVCYAHKGLMVDTVMTKPVVNKDGRKLSVIDALKTTDFSKVYLMLGINETGWAYSSIFQSKYGQLIDAIREINPDATIYIQGIMPVSNTVSSTHAYVKNSKISEYNGLLKDLAAEKQVYYIDTETAVAAADGSLPEDAAADGVHLVQAYCYQWLDYLKTHTITQPKER